MPDQPKIKPQPNDARPDTATADERGDNNSSVAHRFLRSAQKHPAAANASSNVSQKAAARYLMAYLVEKIVPGAAPTNM